MDKDATAYIDFAQNLNPFGPPKSITNENVQAVSRLQTYGEVDSEALRTIAAPFFGVSSEQLTVANGTTEIFFTLPSFLKTTKAIVPLPTFWEYGVVNERAGVPIDYIPLNTESSFSFDPHILINSLIDGATVYLGNICNPTSQLLDKARIAAFIEEHPDINFVVDETYLTFREDFQTQTLSQETARLKNLYIVTSLSKFFTIPGARVGFLICNEEATIKYRKEILIPYNVSPIAQFSAMQALRDSEFIASSREFFTKQRKTILPEVTRLLKGKLEIVVPQGNFILAHLPTGIVDAELNTQLREQYRIQLRLGSELPGLSSEWIRFCIRSEKETGQLLSALAEIL